MTKIYQRLQDQIDFLIVSMGNSDRVVDFLDSFLSEKINNEDKISNFINCAVAYYFEISTDELFNLDGKKRSSSACRKICYKLHQQYLEYSIRRIGKIYGRRENAVMRGIHEMEDIIKKPNIDFNLNKAYLHIDNHVQKFINYYLNGTKEIQNKKS